MRHTRDFCSIPKSSWKSWIEAVLSPPWTHGLMFRAGWGKLASFLGLMEHFELWKGKSTTKMTTSRVGIIYLVLPPRGLENALAAWNPQGSLPKAVLPHPAVESEASMQVDCGEVLQQYCRTFQEVS